MPMFLIILSTVLLTVGMKKFIEFAKASIRKDTMAALAFLCKVAFNENCFTIYMNKLGEEILIVNLCESCKYIIFNNETIRNMPKDTTKSIEYIRNLPLVDRF